MHVIVVAFTLLVQFHNWVTLTRRRRSVSRNLQKGSKYSKKWFCNIDADEDIVDGRQSHSEEYLRWYGWCMDVVVHVFRLVYPPRLVFSRSYILRVGWSYVLLRMYSFPFQDFMISHFSSIEKDMQTKHNVNIATNFSKWINYWSNHSIK